MSNVNSCGKVQSFGDLIPFRRVVVNNAKEFCKVANATRRAAKKEGSSCGVEIISPKRTEMLIFNRNGILTPNIGSKFAALA